MLVAFVLFVVNQISGVYLLAREVHPGFGLAVLWTLILLFGALVAIPVVLYFRLPKPLPAPENDEARAVYLQALGKRLSKTSYCGAKTTTGPRKPKFPGHFPYSKAGPMS